MQLAPRTSWSSVLYLSFCLQCSVPLPSAVFSYVQPQTNLLMSTLSSFHWGMNTFLVTPSMCCVFICTNSRHTLKTSLCCAFYWRKPCHDHTFDLLCFHMYKPQSNLNSRQRTKPAVAAHKKEINWTFLSNPVAPAGIVRPHRFEVRTRFGWGLYIWKPACQSFATWSVPAIVKRPMGRVFRVCSKFVYVYPLASEFLYWMLCKREAS